MPTAVSQNKAGLVVTPPRIETCEAVELPGVAATDKFGASELKSSKLPIFLFSIWLAVNAEMAMGTSWMRSERFCAVTMISSMPADGLFCAKAAVPYNDPMHSATTVFFKPAEFADFIFCMFPSPFF